MKQYAKPLLVVCIALLLIFATVFSTLAFLQDETSQLLNTFTAGKVSITLDEATVTAETVDEEGIPLDPVNNRTDMGNTYKLIPGASYYKDPTIHVSDDSENCLLFVKIDNTAGDAVIFDLLDVPGTVTTDGQPAAWKPLTGQNGVYYLEKPVLPGSDVVIFNGFEFSHTVEDMTPYAGTYIAISAYALQAEGFFVDTDGQLQDPATAWAAFPENQSFQ